MQTLTSLFDSYDQARLTVYDLEEAGIASEDITLVARHQGPDGDGAIKSVGAGVGATLGGAGGLLAGMAGLVVPGIGQAVGVGWLVTALAGAAAGGVAGGIVGALVDAGIDDGEANVFAEGVKRGGALVTVRAHDSEVADVSRILRQHHPVDVAKRRREYEDAGWSGFSTDDPWEEKIGSEDR
jgi:hypothetical protein